MEVLALQDKPTLCDTGAVPEPVSGSCSDGFEALLATVTLAEADPVACGVKVTVNPTLLPGVTVAGREMPLTENSALFDISEVTTTVPPVATSCPVRGLLALTVMLPKAKGLGFTLSAPTDVPVPLSDSVRFGTAALETMSRLPELVPVVVGAKLIPKVKLCPAESVNGSVSPLMVYAEPVIVACDTIMLEPPGFFSVSESN